MLAAVGPIKRLLEYVPAKLGFAPRLCHDAHSHLSAANAVELRRRAQPHQIFSIEDMLSPEQLVRYKQIRKVTTTPQAVGEISSHPLEQVR